MRVFRATGAGKRNAISASLKRRPGLSSGEIQAHAMRTSARRLAPVQMKAAAIAAALGLGRPRQMFGPKACRVRRSSTK